MTLVQGNIDAVYKGIYKEAYFAYYWGMYDPNYEERSEGSYSVKVSIEPSYIMKQAEEMYDRYDDLEAFAEKYKFVNVDNMTEEEYELYVNEYAQIIVQMVYL